MSTHSHSERPWVQASINNSDTVTNMPLNTRIVAVEEDEYLESPPLDEDLIPGPPQTHTNGGGGYSNLGSSGGSNGSLRRSSNLIGRVLNASRRTTTTTNNRPDVLQLSSTDHNEYVSGSGILANRGDLNMEPEAFAAGCNLLQYAALGDIQSMKRLLDEGITNLNFRDYDRRTALHVAASEGHLNVCRFLVDECGSRINRSDRWGGSPLDDAHRHHHMDVVEYLRKIGATTGSGNRLTNLIKAAAEGDIDEVRILLKVVEKNVKLDVNKGDYDKRTALHLAAGEGHCDIVKALCEAGAHVNVEDRWGRRPIDDALSGNYVDVAEYLRKHGGQPGKKETVIDKSINASGRRVTDNMQVEFEELEMVDRIGAGAFGEIYKCRWRGTLVAAKIIKTAKIQKEWTRRRVTKEIDQGKDVDDAIRELEENEIETVEEDVQDAVEDFRQEISVLKGLRHPHIVLLLAYSTTENYECLISELMKCSLLDVFKSHMVQGTRMSSRTRIIYALHLALGMNYLHTCKPPIIHRDLKPANLLVDHSGNLKISDFGLSKVRPDPGQRETDVYRMTGETGSYRFMAPEVYRHEDYDETVDIYSYAMILFYLLVGRPPWAHLAGLDAVRKAAEEGDRPTLPRDLNIRLLNLMKECWDDNPKARPPFISIIKTLTAYRKDSFHVSDDDVIALHDSSRECNCIIQ